MCADTPNNSPQNITLNTASVDSLADDFGFFESADEKYQYVIDLGKKLPAMDDAYKTDATRVDGCMSQVWLTCTMATAPTAGGQTQQVLTFQGDSDSIIARGLVGLVIALYTNKTPADIVACDAMELFQRIGFGDSISMNRRSGFTAMVARIQQFAQSHI